MKRLTVLMGLVLALVFAAGCGATTSSTIAYHEEALRSPNDAIVYFFRQKDIVGSAGSFNVYVDGQLVGKLKQNAYMPVHVLPGKHSLQIGEHQPGYETVERAVDNIQGFAAKAGETYYILSKGAYVSLLSKDQALPILREMKYDMGD